MKTFKTTSEPKSSPWGAVQYAEELAPGIWSVGTAGHGGLKLSPERYAAMPEYMKATDHSSGGWFEEDCDWALVALVFPEAFKPKVAEAAKGTVEHWHPAVWAKFGEAL